MSHCLAHLTDTSFEDTSSLPHKPPSLWNLSPKTVVVVKNMMKILLFNCVYWNIENWKSYIFSLFRWRFPGASNVYLHPLPQTSWFVFSKIYSEAPADMLVWPFRDGENTTKKSWHLQVWAGWLVLVTASLLLPIYLGASLLAARHCTPQHSIVLPLGHIQNILDIVDKSHN